MNEIKPFDDRLNGLSASLSPAVRRKLAAEIAKELRKSQQQHIRRAMFQKLRMSRYMKASGRNDDAVVEFTSKVQRIALVHQFGLKERPTQGGRCIYYPERQLLGFGIEDKGHVERSVVEYISARILG